MNHTIKLIFKRAIFLVGFFVVLQTCNPKSQSENKEDTTKTDNSDAIQEQKIPDNTLTKAESEAGWLLLFNGKDTKGWRSFNSDKLSGWVIEDGTFKSLGKGGDTGGDIVYGAEEFENFELYLEWKIAKGGNSGIFYHVQEGKKYKAAYHTAPEYQLLDDIDFPEKLEDWQKLGADYAMYTADSTKKNVKKAGEWNNSKILFTTEKVEHWLNGNKIVSFPPWSADWKKRKTEGKWKEYPDYGEAKKGLIGLQDHGSVIWFKNMKIKKL